MKRESLRVIAARIERLAASRPSRQLELESRTRRMTDPELEWEIVTLIEQRIGPIGSYQAREAVISALQGSPFNAADQGHELLSSKAQEHWERLHWFQQHVAHGRIDLVWKEPDSWARSPWGRRYGFECSCAGNTPWATGVRLGTYEQLVPDRFKTIVPG